MASPITKAKGFCKNFVAHWSTPYPGRNIANKEVVAYGGGGMGVFMVTNIVGIFGLSASNFFIGSCLGLKPMDLQIMLTVANIIGFLITSFRCYVFDNIKSKEGKFRPFLKWMAIPTVAISIIFVWLPYENMSYLTKVIVVEFFYLLINCVAPFYSEAYSLLIQVMSPDADERTDVMSVAQIIFSFAPTVVNLIIPILAQLTGGLTSINTYRIVYPIIAIVGVFVAYPTYKYTKERIVKPRSMENEIRFVDAIRSVSKNKYFWIINFAGWIGFAEGAYGVILGWTFVYGNPEKEALLGVANTVIGNGALWAMMAAPFLIRALGKRNLLIGCNIANIFLLALLYPFYNNIWMVIVIFYINGFVGVLGNIYNPGIQADMKDYQQYLTGERIDAMFGVVGMIGTVLGFGTGLVVPFLQQICGLEDDYSVLYDAELRGHLFEVLIIASVIGATLNVIPYFFYDLTEKKQKSITNVLRIRAMFDDYSCHDLGDETLISAMEVIHTATALKGADKKEIIKDGLKKAKKLPKKTAEEKAERKAQIKAEKSKLKEIKQHNIDIDLAPLVWKEMEKFQTERFIKQAEISRFILGHDTNTLEEICSAVEITANALPKNTKEERESRSDVFKIVRTLKNAVKLRKKYFPDGVIVKPEDSKLEQAQNLPNNTIANAIRRKLEVRKVLKEFSVYRRIVKPFTDSNKLLTQKAAYEKMDDLEKRYAELMLQRQQQEA